MSLIVIHFQTLLFQNFRGFQRDHGAGQQSCRYLSRSTSLLAFKYVRRRRSCLFVGCFLQMEDVYCFSIQKLFTACQFSEAKVLQFKDGDLRCSIYFQLFAGADMWTEYGYGFVKASRIFQYLFLPSLVAFLKGSPLP